MRKLIVLAAVLVLIAPLATSGQQYACGEASEIATGKTTSALRKLRDRVNLKPIRKRGPANPDISLFDYEDPAPDEDQRQGQARVASPKRTAPALATSDRPKMHRGGVAQIPTVLPEETKATQRMNQVRFIDQPLRQEKVTARIADSQPGDHRIAEPVSLRLPPRQVSERPEKRRLQLRRKTQRDVDPDRGILDPAHKYAGKWQALPTVPTINSLMERRSPPNAPDQKNVRASDNRQMSAEEVAAYVRNRRQSGFRWPWSK